VSVTWSIAGVTVRLVLVPVRVWVTSVVSTGSLLLPMTPIWMVVSWDRGTPVPPPLSVMRMLKLSGVPVGSLPSWL
jgi:hypothetical protein